MRLVRVCRGICITFLLFVGKNKVILGSDVRLVRVCRGTWILFLFFVCKNKVILVSDVRGW